MRGDAIYGRQETFNRRGNSPLRTLRFPGLAEKTEDSTEPAKVTVLMRRKEIDARRNDDRLIHALRLARAVNTLRFVLDHATAQAQSDSVEAMRARYTGGILLTAAVFEALHVINDGEFRKALQGTEHFEMLEGLRTHSLSVQLKRGYLSRIRNKLAFHYVAKSVKQALRGKHPDPMIIAQWDTTPTSGIFYVLPELDILLSIPSNEVPTRELVVDFQARYPFTHLLQVPPGKMPPEARTYFECHNAVMVIAFAICHVADRILMALFQQMDAMNGDEQDEGVLGL